MVALLLTLLSVLCSGCTIERVVLYNYETVQAPVAGPTVTNSIVKPSAAVGPVR